MKVSYKPFPSMLIEFEASDNKDLFSKTAAIQEITKQTCGCCGKADPTFQVRKVDDFTYYELRCECGATLSFGSPKENPGQIYPRRYEMNGSKPKLVDGKKVYLPNNGWQKWSDKKDEE